MILVVELIPDLKSEEEINKVKNIWTIRSLSNIAPILLNVKIV